MPALTRRARPTRWWAFVASLPAWGPAGIAAAADAHPPVTRSPAVPDAVVDLASDAGLKLVSATWRVHAADFVEARGSTADGSPAPTFDLAPRAGAADFDDSAWPTLPAETIHARQGPSRLSAAWFRTRLTLPERLGDTPVAGATIVLDCTVDDYAEVWVDGRQPLVLGQSGGPSIAGFNTPSRVVLTTDASPGQTIALAILGLNGPVSAPPANRVWLRSAYLDVYRTQARLTGAREVPLAITRKDPRLDRIVPPGATLELLASGFAFTEGPVWVPARSAAAGNAPVAPGAGYLLFSDPNQNVIHRYAPPPLGLGDVSVYLSHSGFTAGAETPWGGAIGRFGQPGSNGLALDPQGRLTLCQHGGRRIVRHEPNGDVTLLCDRFGSKRLNSPNDLVYRSDGVLFFTDPPFGLPAFHDDPARELPHAGVYAVTPGAAPDVRLLSTDLRGPNGIAFSPDERILYVSNWDDDRKIIMAWDLSSPGSAPELSRPRVFFSMQFAPGPEALDGLKVDAQGNVYASGPGGLWIIAPDGTHLGTLAGPELPANFAWGDADGRTLYLTARTGLYRLRLNVPGAGLRWLD